MQFVFTSNACEQKIWSMETKLSRILRHPEPPACLDLENVGKALVPKIEQAHGIYLHIEG